MEYKEYRKELKRLSRTELLELMVEQSKELDRVRQELVIAKAQLNDREIRLSKAGSIAEASLALSKVFEAAQAAADEYLKSVRMQDRCSDEDWDRILDEAAEKRDSEEQSNRKDDQKNRRNRKARIVLPRTALRAELQQMNAKHPDVEIPAEIQTTEARYSAAAEFAEETAYYDNEETESGAVTAVSEAMSEASEDAETTAEAAETETESTYYNNVETEADAETVNDEAAGESYADAQDADEITETAEDSEAETAKLIEATAAQEAAEPESSGVPSEGEMIGTDIDT